MMNIIQLTFADLVSALALMGIVIALSAWEKLGLELKFAIATGRTLLQVVVLGYILDIVFTLHSMWAVLAMLAVMLSIAAIIARNRIEQKNPFMLPLVWVSMLFSSTVAIMYINLLIIQPKVWFEPQYLIPIAGMILASAMNAAAIAGERLVKTINSSQQEIETHLSLGASPQQAIRQYRQEAIRAGLIPSINQMTIIAMIAIPTFFSGQLLSGVNPREAASYQILIVFAIAFTNLLTSLLVTWGICRQSFNSAAQLVVR
ncbi:ABC transporter permease [Mastigocoleus testarum]|nr:iron export ABC transporter permease subunit FetB [Mastigocoleus testarum]